MPDGTIAYPRDFKYLDFHLITHPKSAVERSHNKQLLALAETIRAKYEVELAYDTLNLHNPTMQYTNFYEYFNSIVETKKHTFCYNATLNSIKDFAGEHITFAEITESFCQKFLQYLQTKPSHISKTLKNSSINNYLHKLSYVLNRAVDDKIISENPCKKYTQNEMDYKLASRKLSVNKLSNSDL